MVEEFIGVTGVKKLTMISYSGEYLGQQRYVQFPYH